MSNEYQYQHAKTRLQLRLIEHRFSTALLSLYRWIHCSGPLRFLTSEMDHHLTNIRRQSQDWKGVHVEEQ
eukprot:1812632-Amphidinium_carterae.1